MRQHGCDLTRRSAELRDQAPCAPTWIVNTHPRDTAQSAAMMARPLAGQPPAASHEAAQREHTRTSGRLHGCHSQLAWFAAHYPTAIAHRCAQFSTSFISHVPPVRLDDKPDLFYSPMMRSERGPATILPQRKLNPPSVRLGIASIDLFRFLLSFRPADL